MQKIKVTVDAVVFGYSKVDGLSILLVNRKYKPFKDHWALPGGFVKDDEELLDAIKRELREETGIKISYIEQLYTFGGIYRDPRGRVISIAYYSILPTSEYQVLKATTDAKEAAWFSIKNHPLLAFDHAEILKTAIERLRNKIKYHPVGFHLLDEIFSFPDLEDLYISILGEDIDRRNFRRKILKLGLLKEVKSNRKDKKAGRPGQLYRFNAQRYVELNEPLLI